METNRTPPTLGQRCRWVWCLSAMMVGQPACAQQPSAGFAQLLRQAEAQSAAKAWAAAAPLWQQVVAANPVQPRFWQRLGQAQQRAGQSREAIRAYEQVVALGGPEPEEAAYRAATLYMKLQEPDKALDWLEKSLNLRFGYLTDAQTDSVWRPLQQNARYRRLVSLVDVRTMSRDEGWRTDLGIFAHEARRRGFAVPRALTPDQLDAAVQRVAAAVPRLTDVQLYIELRKLTALLGDGHSNIFPSGDRLTALRLTLPVQFYQFEEGLFIIAADPKYRELLGAQVLRFGDKTVPEVAEAMLPFLSRDNAYWPKQVAPYEMRQPAVLHALGLQPSPDHTTLTVKDIRGRTRQVVLAADASQPNIWNTLPNPSTWVNLPQTLATPLPAYLKRMGEKYWYETLPGGKVLYFQFNSVRNNDTEPFARFTERLLQAAADPQLEKLVVDLRWNNGGNTYLVPALVAGLQANARLNQAGKLFVLIGRRTFSAAQNTATMLERQTKATFIGEPTGSSPNFVGEEKPFTLPYSGLSANVSDLYWQTAWPDDHRTWLAPQVYLPPTFAASRQNRDLVLEAVLAY